MLLHHYKIITSQFTELLNFQATNLKKWKATQKSYEDDNITFSNSTHSVPRYHVKSFGTPTDLELYRLKILCQFTGVHSTAIIYQNDIFNAVSYTHLDVYKRQ